MGIKILFIQLFEQEILIFYSKKDRRMILNHWIAYTYEESTVVLHCK